MAAEGVDESYTAEVLPLDRYSPERVYPSAKGDKAQFRVRTSELHVEQIGELIARRVIHPEIKTVQHFVRDAIVHRLKYWHDHIDDPKIVERLAMLLGQEDMQRMELEWETHDNIVVTRERQLKRAFDAKDPDHLRMVLEGCVKDAQRMSISAHRQKLTALISDYYDKLSSL